MRDWIPNLDPHPPDGVLLLYLSGELDRKKKHQVAEHLSGCWECMANADELKSGIRLFMKHHEGVVSSGIEAESGIERVRRSLLKLTDEPGAPKRHSSIFPSISWFRASAWIAAVSTSLLIGVVVFSTASPPKLTAAEFLEHAGQTMASKGSVNRGAAYQKVRLTRGTKIIDREIVRGIGATPMHETTPPAWFGTFGPIDWADPLSVQTFARWRAAQAGKRDVIVQGPELITLTTIPEPDGAQIREASLTVRKSDWHVVAKAVVFRGEASLEAREAGYQSGVGAEQMANVCAAPAVNPALARGATRKKPMEGPTATDLDEIEIQARSILFDRRFGFGEEAVSPSIRRTASGLVVSGVILEEARRTELVAALAVIDHVRLDVAASIPVHAPAKRVIAISGFSPSSQSEGRPAQLRGMLIERLHSGSEATRLSNQIVTDASNLLGLAARYRELADRYGEREAELLRPNSRARLIALAERMEDAIHAELVKEDRTLSVVLAGRPETLRPSAGRWQDRARKLYELAARHDALLSRLFAVNTGELHETDSVEENLDRLGALRREMKSLSLRERG